MFDHPTLPGLFSATSSLEAASGAIRPAAPVGRTRARSGRVPAHANLSANQAKALGLLTSGTYGPLSTGSPESANLSSSLASRLMARTQTCGSTLYKLTWKPWTTPSGVSRLRLRASARRTSATGISGWPTPTARDWKDGSDCPNVPINGLLGRTAWLAGWNTATATDGRRGSLPARPQDTGNPLSQQVQLAGWATPTANPNDGDLGKKAARRVAAKERWKGVSGNGFGQSTAEQARLSGWPTPCAQDGPNGGPSQGTDRLPGAAAQVTAIRGRLTASGEMLIGSSAETPEAHAGGPLTLEHSLWLQAIPREWADFVSAATRSMPRSRRSSSARSCKK